MKTYYLLSATLAAVLLSSCAIVPSEHRDQSPSDGYGVGRAHYVPPPPVGPPPAVRELPPHQPSPAYVWLGGHWDWDGARYFWQHGRWVVAPQGQVWEGPRWVHNSKRGWVLIEGRWRNANDSSN